MPVDESRYWRLYSMENENKKRRRGKKPRQEWNPHWSLKLLYTVFSVAVSLAKIAAGAVATVALIVLVCGVVLVGTLGDYLQNDILPQAQNWSIDDYSVEETSFLHPMYPSSSGYESHIVSTASAILNCQISFTSDKSTFSIPLSCTSAVSSE